MMSFFISDMSRPMTKPTKWHVRPAKTQISLGIHPVWSESSLSTWRKLVSLATHWAQGKTLIRLGRCPGWSESSLGAQVILLVLSWGRSYTVYFCECQASVWAASMTRIYELLYRRRMSGSSTKLRTSVYSKRKLYSISGLVIAYLIIPDHH